MGGMGTLVGPIAGAAFFLAAPRGRLALLHRVLPDPGGHHLHRHGDLHAPGPPRLPQAPPERLARRRPAPPGPLYRFRDVDGGPAPANTRAPCSRASAPPVIHGIQARERLGRGGRHQRAPQLRHRRASRLHRAREPRPDPRRHPQLGLRVPHRADHGQPGAGRLPQGGPGLRSADGARHPRRHRRREARHCWSAAPWWASSRWTAASGRCAAPCRWPSSAGTRASRGSCVPTGNAAEAAAVAGRGRGRGRLASRGGRVSQRRAPAPPLRARAPSPPRAGSGGTDFARCAGRRTPSARSRSPRRAPTTC